MSEDKSYAVRLLLNPDLLKKYDPWKLDIYSLLKVFQDYMMGMPLIDFRITGLALRTSSLIYKFKVQNLFYQPRTYKIQNSSLSYPSKEINMPFATEFPVTDIEELFEAFRELLKELEKDALPEHPQAIEPLSIPLINEENEVALIKPLGSEILGLLEKYGSVNFYELIKDMDMLNIVRYFLAILYLTSSKEIDITDGLIIIPFKIQ